LQVLGHFVETISRGGTFMRKWILVAVTLLCSSLWAVAQSSASSSSQPGSEPSSGSAQMSASSSSAGQSFTGCLSGSSGNYTLRDKASGTTYNLQGDDKEIAKHVGEEVSVNGSESAGSPASSAGTPSSSASSTGSTASASAGGSKSLTVSSITKVSSSCSNQ
jgi:hypothetical protein